MLFRSVLGKKLSDFLLKFTNIINELVTNTLNVNSGIIELKSALKNHIHVIGTQGTTLPDKVFIGPYVARTSIKNDFKITGNLKSILLNLEMMKLNYLTALSPQKFISDFNRVN